MVEVSSWDYQNDTMHCEGYHCFNHVSRWYQPFCDRCFRSYVQRGSFISRNGFKYAYDGRRWYCLQDEVSKEA